MRKKSASVVLASFRSSPYGTSTVRFFARCGLAGRPCCASCSDSDTGKARELSATYDAKTEFFRSLLGGEDGRCDVKPSLSDSSTTSKPWNCSLRSLRVPCEHSPRGSAYGEIGYGADRFAGISDAIQVFFRPRDSGDLVSRASRKYVHTCARGLFLAHMKEETTTISNG